MPRRLLLLFAVLLAACDGGPTAPSDVTGVQWSLVSIEAAGAAPISIGQPTRYTLRLEADGQASVGADCNGCGGRYRLNGSTLSMGQLACTLIFCAPPSFAGEYLSLLDGDSRISVDGATLTVTSSRGTLRFTR